MPIMFAKKVIGSYHLAIDGAVLSSAQQAARRKVASASAVLIILSVVGVYFIARQFTTPIKRLTKSVSLLKSGSYHGKMMVALHDELGELTGDFNDMADVILTQQEKLEEYAHGLEEAYLSTVKILATSIDARDDYTLQHSTRVSALSLVGEKLGLGTEELRELEVAALVHDLGKIRIPDQMLKKAGALTKDELHLVKQHPRDGGRFSTTPGLCTDSFLRFSTTTNGTTAKVTRRGSRARISRFLPGLSPLPTPMTPLLPHDLTMRAVPLRLPSGKYPLSRFTV